MSATEQAVIVKIRQWARYADEDLRLARNGNRPIVLRPSHVAKRRMEVLAAVA